jgi:Zn-dependent protease
MEEIWDILIALLALVLAVTWILWDQFAAMGIDFISTFIILLFAIGIGFIAHEMAHKWTAIRYGAAARFVLWPQGILFMFLLAALPFKFIFAAVGAVYIFKPYISRKENGIISIAGPVTNLALCVVFLAVLLTSSFLNISLTQIVSAICVFGIRINAFLAFFNLLPIFVLDGAKVMAWDFKAWLGAIIASLAFMFLI